MCVRPLDRAVSSIPQIFGFSCGLSISYVSSRKAWISRTVRPRA
jgi:hypothetical protein